jgi:hypothetical protein
MLVNILIVLGCLFALILIAAVIIPKKLTIVTNIDIERNKDQVFEYLKHMTNQKYFNKWVMADPNSEMVYTGEDAKVGFKVYWNSKNNNVGEGEQEIIEIVDGEKMKVEIRFVRPMQGTSYSTTTTTAKSDNLTNVNLTFESTSKIPFNVMSALFVPMLRKDMNETLSNLKVLLEKN